jgi:hypothetical protein
MDPYTLAAHWLSLSLLRLADNAEWGRAGIFVQVTDSPPPPTCHFDDITVPVRARWVTLRARWVALRARWVTLRARWVTLRARWVALRARWVTLRARWVTLRARWVMFTGHTRGSGPRPVRIARHTTRGIRNIVRVYGRREHVSAVTHTLHLPLPAVTDTSTAAGAGLPVARGEGEGASLRRRLRRRRRRSRRWFAPQAAHFRRLVAGALRHLLRVLRQRGACPLVLPPRDFTDELSARETAAGEASKAT